MHFQGTFQNLLVVSVSLTLGCQRCLSSPPCITSGQQEDMCASSAKTQRAEQRLIILEDTALLGSRGGGILS